MPNELRRFFVRAAVENMMSNACQLLLMRACTRRAYCKKFLKRIPQPIFWQNF
jgi:hypothetical protein